MSATYIGRYALYCWIGGKWEHIHTFLDRDRALQVMEALFWNGRIDTLLYKLFDKVFLQHDLYSAGLGRLRHVDRYVRPHFYSSHPKCLIPDL